MPLPLSLHHQGFQVAEGTSALREISLDVIRRVTDLEGATTDSGVYFTTEYGEQLASLEKLFLGGLDVVNRLHNAWIPIHRLPQEILLHIFSLTRSRVPLFYTTLSPIRWPFHLSDTRDLKPLLRVCKYWRRMVLGAPALWSHIKLAQYLQNDRYVKQRCAESPLSILLSLQAFHPNILNTIQSLRVRELHIFGPGTYDGLLDGDSLLDFLKTFSADSLEHCTINVGFAQNTLPVRRLFSGRGENLKSLYLGRVPFLPDNCFPGLTRLVLAGMPTLNENSSGQKWMVSDLVRFLSGSPRLEELGLYRVDLKQLKGTASDSPGRRVASLNRLRYMCFNSLVFEAAVITMQVILSIIRFPPDCHLALMTFNASSFDALLDILPVEKAYN
ncbi:hypothetical protein L226DRAFT_538522 [Lentinus tigrinus ALCF2SS1-7]|uniref:F-box domain-containing protein n=1 Tax=Lentinus tigrinus ALCF2SS1-6 TaxID=1328759 RepID=A0A5C2S9B5_9APHY|nr:hypothetical protein L227DRAFT_100924 [Lentinus tigrinus ALCF2SS1-6]RPD70922.1 hypothetical protein L226DRAFT_538522 [Lentinus tigrinus ALCF2SS1-7]